MKIYITKTNGLSLEDPLQYKQWMIAEIAHGIGCREMGILCYNGSSESTESLRSRIDGIIAGLSWGDDIVVCQFPTGNGVRFEWELVDRLKVYQMRVIIFLQDCETLIRETSQADLKEKIRLYNRATVLIVPSLAVRRFLLDNGLKEDMKFIIQEIWDYTTDVVFWHSPKFRREIYFMGTGKIDGMDYWNYTPQLKLYGSSIMKGGNVQHIAEMSQEEVVLDLSKGGFGLVWYQDADSRQGMEYGIPLDISRYLAAGIPVIVPKGVPNQELIEKNHLGLAVGSLDEAVEQIENMKESDYRRYVMNIRRFSPLIRNGYFARKILVDAIQTLIRQDIIDCAITNPIYEELQKSSAHPGKIINIMNMQDTLEYVRTKQISVARFGDGEVFLMTGQSISYQEYDEELAKRLRQVITMPENDKLLVCLPDIFEKKERYNISCKTFWEKHFAVYYDFWNEVIVSERRYGSAFLSRPYMDLVDKSISEKYFQSMEEFFSGKDILIVEGSYSQSGVGNDLFQGAKSVARIICPSRNAYSKYSIILDMIRQNGMNKLILLMLGPTAKVLAYDLALEGYWAVDLGHIDSEYEWYRMGATKKVKFENKHTAEFNFDKNIQLQTDDRYTREIVAMLSD